MPYLGRCMGVSFPIAVVLKSVSVKVFCVQDLKAKDQEHHFVCSSCFSKEKLTLVAPSQR